VLAIGRSLETGAEYPVLWTVERAKGRTVVLTLGHDGRAHEHPAFKQLYANSVRWTLDR
jgi:type 1 glutamine amidotransferase